MDLIELDAQLLSTQAAIRALINLHPDPNAAALAVQQGIEAVISAALPKTLPDAYIEGLQKAKERMLPSASDQARWNTLRR